MALRRALIVDDSESSRLLVQQALDREGFSTVAARDGAEAIEILERDDQYEIIVLDLMMPEVDGYGVIDHLRAGDGFPKCLQKILVVTATPGLIQAERLGDPLCEVLAKPFSTEVLLQRLPIARK